MTRYHVLLGDELMSRPDVVKPDGFRFIEPSMPGDDGWSRWWLVEDDNAPADLEQQRIDVVFTRDDKGRVTITERHIVNRHGRRVREAAR